jgi:hypothetical protein
MRDFWFDLASSISAEAFHMPSLTFKPTLLQADSSTPPVAPAGPRDGRRGAGARRKPPSESRNFLS